MTTNTWTYENRLRTVTLATPATTTFTYDGDGLRRQTVTAAGTTNFIWDGQDVLLETDVSNNTQVTYTQTPAMYGNLVSQRRSTTTKYYHFDALGSTVALTDSGENVTDTYKYFAFGESLTSTGVTVNNLRFVGNLGYYNESALALQYLRARYYQPETGRFVSADPIRHGLNWYVYVSNRPVNMVDPSGLKKKPKPCEDGPPPSEYCKVYFWIGNTMEDDGSDHIAALYSAAMHTKKHLESWPHKGYKVTIEREGTAELLVAALLEPATVGIATGSHGGCGPHFPRDPIYNYAAHNFGLHGVYVGASIGRTPLGFVDLPSIRSKSSYFVKAYFGHCYTYKNEQGNYVDGDAAYCHTMYAMRLGLPKRKVAISGRNTQWWTIEWDFWKFHSYFPRKCPLL